MNQCHHCNHLNLIDADDVIFNVCKRCKSVLVNPSHAAHKLQSIFHRFLSLMKN